jgi:hypothetical protein
MARMSPIFFEEKRPPQQDMLRGFCRHKVQIKKTGKQKSKTKNPSMAAAKV